MSILIKGMEMPKNCHECRMYEADIYYCTTADRIIDMPDSSEGRCTFCPLVPVPEHGDLIDRDALRASIRESIEECYKWADEVDKDTMMYARISQSIGTFVECSLRAKAAPAIIPASDKDTNVLCKKDGET